MKEKEEKEEYTGFILGDIIPYRIKDNTDILQDESDKTAEEEDPTGATGGEDGEGAATGAAGEENGGGTTSG